MARAAKITKTRNPAIEKRKPGRPAGSGAKTADKTRAAATEPKPTAKTAETSERRKPGRPRKTATAGTLPKGKATTKAPASKLAAPPILKVSKDELRAQVEKLKQVVATLRTKGREANKAAKADRARITELETQVARLKQKTSPSTARQPQQARAKTPARGKRKGREIDPGDAVPPGVAVQDPEPLDEEAETALENLN